LFSNKGWKNVKISGNEKRREKEIPKNAQRETAREKGKKGVKEVIACLPADSHAPFQNSEGGC
jgi:hypothetical protein